MLPKNADVMNLRQRNSISENQIINSSRNTTPKVSKFILNHSVPGCHRNQHTIYHRTALPILLTLTMVPIKLTRFIPPFTLSSAPAHLKRVSRKVTPDGIHPSFPPAPLRCMPPRYTYYYTTWLNFSLLNLDSRASLAVTATGLLHQTATVRL